MTIQAIIVICALALGIRVGGIGIGASCMAGVLLLVGIFGAPPSGPPVDVIFIVLTVVGASSALQAAGGVAFLIDIAEKLLRKAPHLVTFVAPTVSYVFTFLSGTGYIVYALLPVISEVSIAGKVRPERPLSISVIASQLAITGSPVSAATAAMLGLLAKNGSKYSIIDIMSICIPSTIAGCAAGAFIASYIGKDLDWENFKPADISHADGRYQDGHLFDRRLQILSVLVFVVAVTVIVFFGLFGDSRPSYFLNGTPHKLEMPNLIEIVMSISIVMTGVLANGKLVDVTSTPIMRAGIIALFSITGVAWLGNCFFDANKSSLIPFLSMLVSSYPILFSLSLFVLSTILYSQAATVVALMGLGFTLGIDPLMLIAFFPAVNGFFFFPTSGTVIAATVFDRTGSTKIGAYILNHSFMIPGFISVFSSIATAQLLVRLY